MRKTLTLVAVAAAAAAVVVVITGTTARQAGTYTPAACHAGMTAQQVHVVSVTDDLAADLYQIQAGQESGADRTADIAANWAAGFAVLVCDYQSSPRGGEPPAQAWPWEVDSLRYSGAKYHLDGYTITVYGAALHPAAGNAAITAARYRPVLCTAGMTRGQLSLDAGTDTSAGDRFYGLATAAYSASRSASGTALDVLSAVQGAESYASAVADSAARWCDDLYQAEVTGRPVRTFDPGAPGGGYADPTIVLAGNGPW